MKKTLAFIVTLFVSFLVFISTAKAVGGEKPVGRNEAFCTIMLGLAKKQVRTQFIKVLKSGT